MSPRCRTFGGRSTVLTRQRSRRLMLPPELACCLAAVRWSRGRIATPTAGTVLLAFTGIYLHTTLRGKLRIWERELHRAGLKGNEQVLDLGCGRGAVLIEAARQLPDGRAVGVDLWSGKDQSGNRPEATLANAAAAGVADRVEVHTADMTAAAVRGRLFRRCDERARDPQHLLARGAVPRGGRGHAGAAAGRAVARRRFLAHGREVCRAHRPGHIAPTRARLLVRHPIARHHAAACRQGALAGRPGVQLAPDAVGGAVTLGGGW
jgi:hypothetical protein